MARFIGHLQGGRGAVSRLGTPKSGITARVQGWNVGVDVVGGQEDGRDVFYIYATGGSNDGTRKLLVAVVSRDEARGPVVSETPAEYNARLEREALANKTGPGPSQLFVRRIGMRIEATPEYPDPASGS